MATGPYNQSPPAGGPPYPPRRRRGASFWVMMMVLLLSVLFNFSLCSMLFQGGVPVGDGVIEQQVAAGATDATIPIIPLYGAIMGSGTDFSNGADPVTLFRLRLDHAEADPTVKAVIIEIDSPGGAVNAFDQIHQAILDFKASTQKPVIIAMGGIAASGGYYASVAGDYLFAQPATLTGSIGVIIPRYDLSGALDTLNIKYDAIKSGKSKDSLSPGKSLGTQQREHLQNLVNEAYEMFLKHVRDGRGDAIRIGEDQLRNDAADGRILTANQALNYGLIDQIGYLDDVIEKARELAGARDATVVRYTRKKESLIQLLLGSHDATSPKAGVNIQIDLNSLVSAQTPKLLFLWTAE